MVWTTPSDAKAQLTRLWERGDLLRPIVTGEPSVAIRLTLKGPNSSDMTDRFDAVRAWATELAEVPQIRVEWREVRHRVQGVQRLPDKLWIDTVDSALAILGKRRVAEQFSQLVEMTRVEAPGLVPWLAKRPLQAIDLVDQWPRLLAVVQWIVAHPRPGIYLRQVDVPGVHSKFIEAHRVFLSELLDLVLPEVVVQNSGAGIGQFASRYGFLEKPIRIRFRVLDEAVPCLPVSTVRPDITLDARSFAGLELPVSRIFITENETNFLAFPPVAKAIVIFGAGYGWDALANANWMARCAIHYWGDIDTHGFAILDQLRRYFEHATSLLMDRETLLLHESHWGEEISQTIHDLPRLLLEERALFDDLRDNRIRKNLRLEQERVGFQWAMDAIEHASGMSFQ